MEPNSLQLGQKMAKSDNEKRIKDNVQSSQENRAIEPQIVESSSDGLYEANQQKTNLYYFDPLFQQDNEMFGKICNQFYIVNESITRIFLFRND